MKKDAEPMINATRIISDTLKEPLCNELNRLTEMGIIKEVEEPTE